MNDESHTDLLEKIKEIETKIEDLLDAGKEKFSYEIKQGKAVFTKEVLKLQQYESKNIFVYIIQTPIPKLLSAPIVYSMIFPIIILDIFLTIYQWICFPIYKIKKIKRKDHIVMDRHRLKYLNSIEKVN